MEKIKIFIEKIIKKITKIIIKKLPKSLPAGFESTVQETGQIPDCGFYLPVSIAGTLLTDVNGNVIPTELVYFRNKSKVHLFVKGKVLKGKVLKGKVLRGKVHWCILRGKVFSQ